MSRQLISDSKLKKPNSSRGAGRGKASPVEVTTEKESRQPRVQSVDRAVRILLAVAHSAEGLKAVDIGKVTDLPKQATYHLVHTLVTTGMLRRTDRGNYALGLGVSTLVDAFSRQLDPPEYLGPLVRRIASETGETTYASGWLDMEIVNLVTAKGSNAVHANEVPHGFSGEAHARASGKLLLAFASESRRAEYLATHKLSARTPNTITSERELLKQFDSIRATGYSIDNEEFAPGICCLAVGVANGSLPYALTVSAPSERLHQKLDTYLETMRRVASLARSTQG